MKEKEAALEAKEQELAEVQKQVEELEKITQEKAALEEELKKAEAELSAMKNAIALKKGDTITVANVKYRVTNAEKKTAVAYGVKNKKSKNSEDCRYCDN